MQLLTANRSRNPLLTKPHFYKTSGGPGKFSFDITSNGRDRIFAAKSTYSVVTCGCNRQRNSYLYLSFSEGSHAKTNQILGYKTFNDITGLFVIKFYGKLENQTELIKFVKIHSV